ncbi:MAG: PAS domain S-box protein [Geobacteraceae bacterium]|nr:PAS domain S-box protein [Geobacteraceae bacterium]
MRPVTKYILASSLIAILSITLFGFYSLDRYHDTEAMHERERLEVSIRTFWQLLASKGTDYRVVAGKLMAGDYEVNGDHELPDKVQAIFGGVATIFMGDERVSTNVLDANGKRAVGTKLVGAAHDAIFKQGVSYRGATTILGSPYLTAYDPIRNQKGEVIGVLFVGVKEGDFLARLHVMKKHLTLVLSGIVAGSVLLMTLMVMAMKRIETESENQGKFQQTLMDTIPTPVFFKDANCRYLGCNKAFEEYVGFSREQLIGKTPHELWPADLAERYQQQDLALLQNPGMQAYETVVRYADGTLRDAIFNKATFNGNRGTVGGLVGVVIDITERKKAEDELAFQNLLLSTQQEASIDGILVVDENARILSFNRRFVEIMGIPPQLTESKEDEPVLEYVKGRMVDPDGFLEKVRYLYRHRQESSRDELVLLDGKTLDRYTVPLIGADGRYYGRLWSFRDITERKAAEEEAKSAYQQLMDIVEFLPDATFVVDREKKVIAWNRAMENMTGLKKEDVMGNGNHIYSVPFYGEARPILIDLIDEDPEVISINYTNIKIEGGTLSAEARVPSFRNGDCRYFWAIATPLFDKSGNRVGGIESIRDITENRRAENEKSRMQAKLHHARMMESLMVRLGHDLKTPLTPLFALLPLVRERVADSGLRKMLDICCKNISSIKELTDKTRMLVRLSYDIKPYELESVTLYSLVNDCLALKAGLLADKNIDCRIEIDEALMVQVVPDQLNELFANLISNAAHYAPENGSVRISAEQCGEAVTVSITDNGIGVAPDHLKLIFDEFFKVDESRHDLEASGLGLSICKRIVLNHNGRIWAESDGLGHGTSIFFTLNKHFAGIAHGEKEIEANG